MKALLCSALLLFAPVASAQTIVNPVVLEFTVSPDHNVVDARTGKPLVDSYDYVAVGNGGVTVTIGLGKPAAGDGEKVKVLLPGLLSLTTGITYTATVVAKGPGGVSPPSPASNSFSTVVVATKAPASPSNVTVK